MVLLALFAFIAGVVTVLSPCILPILPLILSSSVGTETNKKARPFGVILGFVLSFTLFTLFLSSIVRLLGIGAESLRVFSIIVITLFGVSLLLPAFQMWMEGIFSRLTNIVPRFSNHSGFVGGFLVGLSLGLLWTPCVGPILASVISLALTGSVTFTAFLITLSYTIGTAIPMLLIMQGGRTLLMRVPWLMTHTGAIQKGFGVLMILTALAIYTNLDRSFQTWIISTFPQYGAGLTKLEDRASVRDALRDLQGKTPDSGSPATLSGELLFNLLPKGPLAPALIPGGAWINLPTGEAGSVPLTLDSLKGKVVIVDFWTYSCINCQRTLPYMKAWYSKYADKGLVIIGVHSPEFEFEKNEKNVRKAVADFGLQYPVMQDNDFATWRAYDNHYWPAKYFVDKDGYIRYTHFGEGDYDKSEQIIQSLLKETGAQNIPIAINNPEVMTYANTGETYLGYARISHFASPERVQPDITQVYTLPRLLGQNEVAYDGAWTIASEYASPSTGAALNFDFNAKEMYLVMRSKEARAPAHVRVLVDGIAQHGGGDVVNGIVTVDTDRLYQLVKLSTPGHHVLRLEFLDDHVETYAFTFG